jgi:hypothetical protein
VPCVNHDSFAHVEVSLRDNGEFVGEFATIDTAALCGLSQCMPSKPAVLLQPVVQQVSQGSAELQPAGGPFMGLSVLAVSCSVLLQLQKPADGTAHVMAQMEAP